MRSNYNQNYTREQVCSILDAIKDCIRENHYIISRNENRQENIDFINEFYLTSYKQKEILLGIEPEDFCHSLKNTNKGFEYEILYVFCPEAKLFDISSNEITVNIYTKFNIIVSRPGKRVAVISFHRLNRPINYLFR